MFKNFIILTLLLCTFSVTSQNAANRFFYELSFQPSKESSDRQKVTAILDVTDDYSKYRDFTMIAQDSLLKSKIEEMKNSGSFIQMEKLIKKPAFGYRIVKDYPTMDITYIDGIERNLFGYEEDIDMKWKVEDETKMFQNYEVQKATLNFGGRDWVAWFAPEIPISDGPYKFHNLPGLIVHLYDSEKNYEWQLAGNKKISNYDNISFSDQIYYGENLEPKILSKKRFLKNFNQYKEDPMGAMRSKMDEDMLNKKMPGQNITYRQMIDSQEQYLKNYFNANNNPIEIKKEVQ